MRGITSSGSQPVANPYLHQAFGSSLCHSTKLRPETWARLRSGIKSTFESRGRQRLAGRVGRAVGAEVASPESSEDQRARGSEALGQWAWVPVSGDMLPMRCISLHPTLFDGTLDADLHGATYRYVFLLLMPSPRRPKSSVSSEDESSHHRSTGPRGYTPKLQRGLSETSLVTRERKADYVDHDDSQFDSDTDYDARDKYYLSDEEDTLDSQLSSKRAGTARSRSERDHKAHMDTIITVTRTILKPIRIHIHIHIHIPALTRTREI
ncbi:hypothetical protein DHEL01_v200890 [Diaporthe helianthi]|uniref:Uncharacterized protein n=1 Tax=Diaporthe helianthi TaxID=158607 RepID=A0A2P5IDV6_DIAHE|nr:hypothetical protein DHEL01_v200890 [Diaporthe helianthi]